MIPLWTSKRGGPPEPITALTPAAWYRYGLGITVTGSGVSQWSDQSGNNRHLLQGTDAARPPLQSDNSILFDGTADFMSVAFALVQPATIYVLGRQITWTNNDFWFDGVAGNRMGVTQSSTTPGLRAFAGSATTQNNGLALNTYAVVMGLFNGASSVVTVNNVGPSVSAVGAGNGGGIILGSSDTFGFSNIQVKEVIVFPTALSAANQLAVFTYLATVGGLNI